MPFKSLAQAKYLHMLQGKNKLPKSVDIKEYDQATDFKNLPEKAPEPKFKKLRSKMGWK